MPSPTADLRRLPLTLFVALACAPAAAQVGNCEPLREQIAARFKAGGVPQVQLVVMEAAASTPGRVVGTCERGTRKIVQVSNGTSLPRPAARSDEALLTECRDGRVQMGGSCRR